MMTTYSRLEIPKRFPLPLSLSWLSRVVFIDDSVGPLSTLSYIVNSEIYVRDSSEPRSHIYLWTAFVAINIPITVAII